MIKKYFNKFLKTMEKNKCPECKGSIDSNGLPIEEKFENYPHPNITVDALVLRKHKSDHFYDILMIKRGKDPFKNCYALPGGFVDYNEDPQESCLRELKEECNLDGKNIEFFTVRSDPKRDPRKHIVSLIYFVEVGENDEPIAGDDASKAKFYNLKDIMNKKDNFAFDHYDILNEMIEKKFKNIYH